MFPRQQGNSELDSKVQTCLLKYDKLFPNYFFPSGLEQELCIFTQEHCAEVYQPGRCHYCVG